MGLSLCDHLGGYPCVISGITYGIIIVWSVWTLRRVSLCNQWDHLGGYLCVINGATYCSVFVWSVGSFRGYPCVINRINYGGILVLSMGSLMNYPCIVKVIICKPIACVFQFIEQGSGGSVVNMASVVSSIKGRVRCEF